MTPLDALTAPAHTVDELVAEGKRVGIDVVGMVEIGERLGVPRQTVHKWQLRGLLPEPEWRVSKLPAWRWSTIERWARKTGRLPQEKEGNR